MGRRPCEYIKGDAMEVDALWGRSWKGARVDTRMGMLQQHEHYEVIMGGGCGGTKECHEDERSISEHNLFR